MTRFTSFTFAVVLCAGCGGNSDGGLFSATGGSGNVGGSGNTGGSSPGNSGGSSSGSGGSNASGGTGDPSGGASNAGAPNGGAAQGGAAQGGAAQGGAAQGGAAQGGTAHGGSSNGGSAGKADCDELMSEASEALEAAQACNPNTDGLHCVGTALDLCGCPVPIEQPESPAAQAYRAARAAFEESGCSIACLAIVCIEPAGGFCVEQASGKGHCVGFSPYD